MTFSIGVFAYIATVVIGGILTMLVTSEKSFDNHGWESVAKHLEFEVIQEINYNCLDKKLDQIRKAA